MKAVISHGHNRGVGGMEDPVQEFIKCFIRDPSGGWRCVKAADIQLPTGRVQVIAGSVFTRSTRFMNVDLAALLDEQEALGRPNVPKDARRVSSQRRPCDD